MRLGVWLVAGVGVVIAASGCSGGYPLAPTACDEWGHATKGEECPDYYNPSSCVSNCESRSKDLEDCRKELDAEIACFQATPGAAEARCGFWSSTTVPCALESSNLAVCLTTPSDSMGTL
jgi:hypothetical protein